MIVDKSLICLKIQIEIHEDTDSERNGQGAK